MTYSHSARDGRVEIVVLTYNRPHELMQTLEQLTRLPERPQIHVIDNGSAQPVEALIGRQFPEVDCLHLSHNIGAAARNAGVEIATSPYVALCDDDTWYEAGSLRRAAEILDAYPKVAVLTARVVIEPDGRLDPTCAEMAHSPLPSDSLPGPGLLGFLAGASVVRSAAFLGCGGFEPRFFLGGEEELLTLDLRAAGWRLAYVDELCVHHAPSPLRDAGTRRRLLLRNALWVAWLRRPWPVVLQSTLRLGLDAVRDATSRRALLSALRGVPWSLRRRRALPRDLEAEVRLLERDRASR
ncbi:MAG TPA: glycosyltransferase [Dehalococcoidia bacterium]|nr:glycosyltransferase [Dehalococcoidia bacterium]